jgi:mono/diheme cytochrome c family protein
MKGVGLRNWMAVLAGMALSGTLLAETPAAASDAGAGHFIEQNCGKCHNAVDWAGGLAFDTLSVESPGQDAHAWEQAVRKLRGRLMPPPGERQPDQASIDGFVRWMETRLDAAAAARPDPGHVVLHRLNRTEYARAIDELLAVKVDPKVVLPKDVSSDGFDNVAAALKISPAFLEQYINAARAVARQAVARPQAKPASRSYRHPGYDQRAYVAGLPLGTRGGMVVEHYFPADGEYSFSITDFHFGGAGYINRIDAPHRVILTIDDERMFEVTVGGPEDLKLVDQTQAAGEAALQARFNNIRLPVKTGLRRIGVAFVMRSHAESDSQLMPIAMLPEMERYPFIPGLDISGPFNVTGASETESRRRLFTCRPDGQDEVLPCARQILRRVAQQAYRRPVDDQDLEAPLAFFRRSHDKDGFDAGIEAGLTAILSSANFLFRAIEVPEGTEPGSVYRIDDLALASRLAFFLWSSVPDAPLIELAAAGRLRQPEVLQAQVRRMLADRRSSALVTNFAFQWLNVNKMDNVEPDPLLYPDFDRDLREGFREEMRLFLDSILRADRSVVDLLTERRSFLNERLARHYGVPGIRGAQFRAIELPDANRWGLLGKGGVLMGTSYGNRTAPVLRGAWILENITGTPPTAPPLGVEALAEAKVGERTPTVRERLERHRAAPSCNSCHGVMDPLGFALENFDVTGAWRAKDLDANIQIDSRGDMPDGRVFTGPTDLRNALAAQPDLFVQALTEKLMIYALGRGVEASDMPAVRAITRRAATAGYRFESIVQGIVASDAFQLQRLPAADEAAKAHGPHSTAQLQR